MQINSDFNSIANIKRYFIHDIVTITEALYPELSTHFEQPGISSSQSILFMRLFVTKAPILDAYLIETSARSFRSYICIYHLSISMPEYHGKKDPPSFKEISSKLLQAHCCLFLFRLFHF